MDEFNTALVIPSATTISFMVALLFLRKWRALLKGNQLIVGLLISLFFMNLIEVITFGNIYRNFEQLLRLYYCASVVSGTFFLCLSEKLNNPEIFPRKYMYLVLIILDITLIYLILFTDSIVSGAIRNSYTISRVAGDYYWFFVMNALFRVLTGLGLIWRSIVFAESTLFKKRHLVIFISFIPIIITVAVILLLMQLGIEINLSIVLPFCTLIFVVVYSFTENRLDLFRILVNVPYSYERKAYKQLNDRVMDYIAKSQTDENVPLKGLVHEIEKTLINNAIEIKEGNHSLAAEMLSISISTIYRNKD